MAPPVEPSATGPVERASSAAMAWSGWTNNALMSSGTPSQVSATIGLARAC